MSARSTFCTRPATNAITKRIVHGAYERPISELTVTGEHQGVRLDKFLRLQKGWPVTLVHRLVRKRQVTYYPINGPGTSKNKLKGNERVQPGDHLRVNYIGSPYKLTLSKKAKENRPSRSDMDLRKSLEQCILYQDPHLMVINKPYDIACQGGHWNKGKSSIDRAMRAFADTDWASGDLRLVHRLDMKTTGALILAKNRPSSVWLTNLFRPTGTIGFKDTHVQKMYISLNYIPSQIRKKKIAKSGIISAPLVMPMEDDPTPKVTVDHKEGKEAITAFEVIDKGKQKDHHWAILAHFPLTGRKHQIRVHCADVIGAPILGDLKYTSSYHSSKSSWNSDDLNRDNKMHLHLFRISIPPHPPSLSHPTKEGKGEDNVPSKPVQIIAPFPSHFLRSFQILGVNLGRLTEKLLTLQPPPLTP